MEKTKSTRGIGQDRSKVAGGQDYEVQYEAKKIGTTGKKVKAVVGKAGNSRQKVEKKLSGSKSKR